MKYILPFILLISAIYASGVHDLYSRNIFKQENQGNFLAVGPEGLEKYPQQRIPLLDPVPTYSELYLIPDEGPRPNAREISNKFSVRSRNDVKDKNRHTMFSLMFGQFVNHDLENNLKEDEEILSKYHLFSYIKDTGDYACLQTSELPLPHPFRCGPNDTVLLSQVKKSKGVLDEDGFLSTLNGATPFLDLSQVYGSTSEINNKLRTHSGGKLIMRYNHTTTIQPLIPPGPAYNVTLDNILPDYTTTGVPVNQAFINVGNPDYYFTAGDDRVNENAALSLFHTIFAREHNRICDELALQTPIIKVLPQLFDELVYQAAKKINIAQYQHIIYNEYLPNLLGDYFYEKIGEYDGYVNEPHATSLVFASAAFRYGHFQLEGYHFIDECGNVMSNGQVSANPEHKDFLIGFQNPSPPAFSPVGRVADAGGFANIARGLIHEIVAPNGMEMHNIARNLSSPNNVLDLAVFDIIRARYNQVPNYQRIRKHYFGDPDDNVNNIYGARGCPERFEDRDTMSDPLPCFRFITQDIKMARKLRDTFKKVKFIDAIVGIQLEDKVPGSIFGKTGGNILAREFKNVRDRDIDFYKNGFTDIYPQVLDVTMSDILDRNIESDMILPDNLFVSNMDYKQYLSNTCQ